MVVDFFLSKDEVLILITLVYWHVLVICILIFPRAIRVSGWEFRERVGIWYASMWDPILSYLKKTLVYLQNSQTRIKKPWLDFCKIWYHSSKIQLHLFLQNPKPKFPFVIFHIFLFDFQLEKVNKKKRKKSKERKKKTRKNLKKKSKISVDNVIRSTSRLQQSRNFQLHHSNSNIDHSPSILHPFPSKQAFVTNNWLIGVYRMLEPLIPPRSSSLTSLLNSHRSIHLPIFLWRSIWAHRSFFFPNHQPDSTSSGSSELDQSS